MKEALSQTYGRWGSPASKVFGPIVDPRTWLKTAYLAAMFPLGLAYFVALVVAFAVGGALIWTIVGPLVLIPTLFLTRWAGDMEAWLVRHISRIELRRPPTALERGLSPKQQIWTRFIDPSTWTGLVYLLIQFPVGIAALVVLSACGAFVGATVAAPLAIALSDGAEFTVGNDRLVIDTLPESLALVPLGLLALLASVHLLVVLSALHAAWARLMLGSRARAVPAAPQLPEPTPGGPGGGRPVLDESPVTTAASGPAGLASLTTREKEVLALMARGYSNAEIAEAFVISEGTVKTHTKRVLAKLDLRDRTQAASFAYETGFVVPGHEAKPAVPVPIDTRRRSG